MKVVAIPKKKASPSSKSKAANQTFLDRTILETFLEFADPLLDAHGPQTTAAQVEQSLQLAFTIWNAVVYEDATNNRRFIDSVRRLTM